MGRKRMTPFEIELEGEETIYQDKEEPKVPETQKIVLTNAVEIDPQFLVEPDKERLGRRVAWSLF